MFFHFSFKWSLVRMVGWCNYHSDVLETTQFKKYLAISSMFWDTVLCKTEGNNLKWYQLIIWPWSELGWMTVKQCHPASVTWSIALKCVLDECGLSKACHPDLTSGNNRALFSFHLKELIRERKSGGLINKQLQSHHVKQCKLLRSWLCYWTIDTGTCRANCMQK